MKEVHWTTVDILNLAFNTVLRTMMELDKVGAVPASVLGDTLIKEIKRVIEEGEQNEQVPQQKNGI